jgi:hypothetical protein
MKKQNKPAEINDRSFIVLWMFNLLFDEIFNSKIILLNVKKPKYEQGIFNIKIKINSITQNSNRKNQKKETFKFYASCFTII